MSDAKPKKKWRWSRLHFTCPFCASKNSYPRAYALSRFSKENIRARTMTCRTEHCQTLKKMARGHMETAIRITERINDQRKHTRWRNTTPEGRAYAYNKYGPPSGRPTAGYRIERLHNNPRLAEYNRTAYLRCLEKQRDRNLLLGMFNMARKASYPVLTPQAASRLRGTIMARVPKYIQMADEVLQGDRKWNPTQARVFATLLNKVVPDLSASFVQHEHTTRDLRELSRDELERIARGDDAITVEYSDADHKSRETAPVLEHDPPGTGSGNAPDRPPVDPSREP